jgi:GNAT superfamily N-acetyltransferase
MFLLRCAMRVSRNLDLFQELSSNIMSVGFNVQTSGSSTDRKVRQRFLEGCQIMGLEIIIRDMQKEDEEFVGSCTHVSETTEWTASCLRRVPWLHDQHTRGLRAKVALVEGVHAGFLHVMPIEIAPWGPVGRDLMAIQCLTVKGEANSKGVGRQLVGTAEEETQNQGRKAVTVVAFYHDFWFMPAPFFEKCGFEVIQRKDTAAVLWKVFDPSAEPPTFPDRHYEFVQAKGKVAIDLFWSRSCLTTDTEAQRVREVAQEFGDSVLLREYCSDDVDIRSRHGILRAIFVNGKEVGWGYEAPKEGLREKIREAQQSPAIYAEDGAV